MVFGGSPLQGGVVARGFFTTITGVVKGIPTSSASPTVILAGLRVCSISHDSRSGRGDGARKRGGALRLLMLLLVLMLLLLMSVSGPLV